MSSKVGLGGVAVKLSYQHVGDNFGQELVGLSRQNIIYVTRLAVDYMARGSIG